MIIATAGHVDHGKTSLVRALTGVDTDRLKEEKLRGMSIEPGYAYADLGNGFPIGFVDVPGHERFVRNMVAGVAAVDFVLLVVAADDGPMPQTIEHLAILELLGVQRGAVVLTKIDRVSPDRALQAQAELRAALASTFLRDAPLFPVVARDGAGMDDLRQYLKTIAEAWQRRPVQGNFRLAVDRCFSLTGTGVVVTGAVFSGMVSVGDSLILSPQGTEVRVRGMHVHNRSAESASAGWRCALNLAGADLKRIAIERGDWLVAPEAHAPTARFDVRINVLTSQAKALAHWTPVHLHVGAAVVNARVALLQEVSIEPGDSGFAQIVTDVPVVVLHGDRFILRDQSAQRTVAGGVVVDPKGAERGRSKPMRLAQLAVMELKSVDEALRGLLEVQSDGVHLADFFSAWNLTPEETRALINRCPVVTYIDRGDAMAMSVQRWQSMRDQLILVIAHRHAAQPEGLGPTEVMVATDVGLRVLSPAWRARLKQMLVDGSIVREGICLRLPAHRPQLSTDDAALLQRVTDILQGAGLRPPIVGELAKALGMAQPELVDFLEQASRLGHLVRIAKNRFFLPATLSDLTAIAVSLSAESGQGLFDAASYRDRSGIGRNLTIEVLEFMDRTRITRYAGGRRAIAG